MILVAFIIRYLIQFIWLNGWKFCLVHGSEASGFKVWWLPDQKIDLLIFSFVLLPRYCHVIFIVCYLFLFWPFFMRNIVMEKLSYRGKICACITQSINRLVALTWTLGNPRVRPARLQTPMFTSAAELFIMIIAMRLTW